MEDEIYLVVKSIDLLTAEEAKKLPYNIRDIDDWWLLQASNYYSSNYYIAFVNAIAGIDTQKFSFFAQFFADDKSIGIRPALLIENLDELKLPLYTELEIFDKDWIYIGDNKALAKTYLWSAKFYQLSNEYATSKIKQKLDDWLKEKKVEFKED